MFSVEGERRQTVGLNVRTVSASETHDLRRRVLRGGLPSAEVSFPEDDRPGAFHLAACDGDRIVAVATFVPSPTPLRDGATFQLRGMAVEPDRHGQGVGRLLLAAAAERLRAAGTVAVWAHARDSALGFYERLGWKVVGEGYVYGPMGLPHHTAVLDL